MTSIRSRMSHHLTRERVALEVRRARKPFVVLIAMLAIAIAALSYLVGNLRGFLPWQSAYQVHVVVDSAQGVIPGKQEVRISGVPVGQMTGVHLGAGGAVIDASIDPQYAPLYRDATVRLRPRTPLDDLYLDVVSRGHASAGKLGDGQTLQAERTQTPVDIGRVLDLFGSTARVRAKQDIDELGLALGDHGAQLRATLVELAPFLTAGRQLLGELAVRAAHTRRLVHNFRVMVQELGSRQGQLTTLVSGGAASLSGLAEQETALGGTLAELPPTLQTMQSSFAAVRAAADQLDPALDALIPATNALPAGLAALRQLTLDADPALAALRPAVQHLAPLVANLRSVSDNLGSAFSALVPQAPRLDRITAKVIPCELPIQKFFQNTLSVTKFGTAEAAFPRGQLVLGASLLGGVVNDPAQRAASSCAPGGPSK